MPTASGTPDTPTTPLGEGHLGDPLGEQRRFFASRAVVSLGGWSVVQVSGEDRLTWLDSLSSQSLTGFLPGTTLESLILTPQGRVEHGWLMVDDGSSTWLLVEPGLVGSLMAWLTKMVFRSRVSVSDLSDSMSVFAYWSTLPESVSAALGSAVVWVDPWPGVAAGGWAYSAPAHPGEGFQLGFIATDTPEAFDGVERAGSWALDAADIRAGRPRVASEADHKCLPHEADWLRTAVHLNKGCYRGQESVAKVHNLGHPPRRIVLLHLDGTESHLPTPGSPVLAGDTEVGSVTRSVNHHEWGPIALALIRRTTAADQVLTVDADGVAIAANQEVLVALDAGRVNAPSLPKK